MTQAQIDALKVFFLEQLPSGEGVVNALRIRTSLENFLDTLGIVAHVELVDGKLYVNGVEFAGGGTPVTVDSALSTTSENPVQNKVVTAELGKKINTEEKAAANGIATLGADGKLPPAQRPTLDTAISASSTNGVTNQAIAAALANKEDKKAAKNGYFFSDKINNNSLLQAVHVFNVGAIAWGGTTGQCVVRAKLMPKANAAKFRGCRAFFNDTPPPPYSTSGTYRTSTLSSAAGIPLTLGVEYQVERTFSMSAWTQTQYMHAFFDVEATNTALPIEVELYDFSVEFVTLGFGVSIAYADIYNKTAAANYYKLVDSNSYIYTPPKLMGKNWNAMGDSITNGLGLTQAQAYCGVLGAKYQMLVNNYGINGTPLGGPDADSMLARYTTMSANADFITIFGGTNDYTDAIPIGANADNTNATFKGSLNLLCKGLIEKYPKAKIGFITPFNTRSVGAHLPYVDAIIEICALWSIPVLDLYRKSGMYPLNSVHLNAMWLPSDNLHPNADGHKFLADKVEAFLLSL